MEEKVHYFI
jgi:ATP-dependent RNA helicase DDX41